MIIGRTVKAKLTKGTSNSPVTKLANRKLTPYLVKSTRWTNCSPIQVKISSTWIMFSNGCLNRINAPIRIWNPIPTPTVRQLIALRFSERSQAIPTSAPNPMIPRRISISRQLSLIGKMQNFMDFKGFSAKVYSS